MMTTRHRSSSTAHSAPDIARQVFTPQTLPAYISAYFQYFHPHFSFIHRPTFDIERVSLPLLLAVALAGSAQSPPTDDALSARHLYSVAEEYIFDCLHDLVLKGVDTDAKVIEIVQAAALINALLYSSRDKHITRIGLFTRFPVLFSSLRALGLVGARRTVPLQDMTWDQFIAKETKIRVVAAVWFSGCVNTISFNCVPQMMLSEMVGDLPCCDALFEASTSGNFTELLGNVDCVIEQGLSLQKWMAMYLRDDWPGHDSPVFAALDPKLLTLHVVGAYTSTSALA